MMKRLSLVLALFLFTGLAACEDDSAVENAGEAVDQTVDDAGNAAEDATN